MISETDKAVLCDLARISSGEGLAFFVIGAGARFLAYDWPHRVAGGRGTTDWDIAVRVVSWDDFERLKAALTSTARFRVTAADHRLIHVGGRRLDIVPFGGVESQDRLVTYPRGGTKHSVLGLRECEACCIEVPLGGGLSVRVVGPPGLVLLKAKAYLDRRQEQTRDVQDIDFMVATYADTLDEAVVFERAASVLHEEVVRYEDVGAYLLAMDVTALGVARQAMEPLRLLIGELSVPSGRAVDDLMQGAVSGQADRREAIARRYRAFSVGIGR